jgi:hypothetical protein
MQANETKNRCSIEEMLELEAEELSQRVQANYEIIIDGAMSEWGSKVEELFRKLEKSVLLWHQEGVDQKITLVFAEASV